MILNKVSRQNFLRAIFRRVFVSDPVAAMKVLTVPGAAKYFLAVIIDDDKLTVVNDLFHLISIAGR